MTTNDDYIDITPDAHFLDSIRGDKGHWHVLLAEGIDNSLDANAQQIVAWLHPDRVELHDNGVGIARDRVRALFRLGEHGRMPTTALGQFGVGLKYNAIAAGDVMEVRSTSRDGTWHNEVDWRKVTASGKWRVPLEQWSSGIESRAGTDITIRHLRWKRPTESDVNKARESVAYTFYPALLEGRSIKINGRAVPILQEPALDQSFDAELIIAPGKSARIRAGILSDQSSALYGVNVSYRWRVVTSKSPFGCDGYTGYRNLFARVALSGPWGLMRFKNELNDPHADTLEERLLELLRPLLEQCEKLRITALIDDVTAQLNESLPPELMAVRPGTRRLGRTRKPPSRTRPPGTAPDHREHGPARHPRKPENQLIIDLHPITAEDGLGVFYKGRPNRVTLASDHPHIGQLVLQRDVANLRAIALALYVDGKNAGELALDHLGKRWASVLDKQQNQIDV
jgi:hypothetical protein